MLLAAALAVALLVAASRTWVSAALPDPLGGAGGTPVELAGSAVAGAVSALGLVALAAAGAVAAARGLLLRASAVVLALAGAGAAGAALTAVRDPAAAVAGSARVAGAAGAAATGVEVSAWPWLALVPAAGLVLVGGWAAFTGPRWRPAERFETASAAAPTTGRVTGPTTTATPAPAPGPTRPAALWDGLSRGEDPTTPGP